MLLEKCPIQRKKKTWERVTTCGSVADRGGKGFQGAPRGLRKETIMANTPENQHCAGQMRNRGVGKKLKSGQAEKRGLQNGGIPQKRGERLKTGKTQVAKKKKTQNERQNGSGKKPVETCGRKESIQVRLVAKKPFQTGALLRKVVSVQKNKKKKNQCGGGGSGVFKLQRKHFATKKEPSHHEAEYTNSAKGETGDTAARD